ARDAGLTGEVPADVGDDALPHTHRVERLARQLGAELADDEHVDRVLEVGERLLLWSRGDGRLGGDETLVELHALLPFETEQGSGGPLGRRYRGLRRVAPVRPGPRRDEQPGEVVE